MNLPSLSCPSGFLALSSLLLLLGTAPAARSEEVYWGKHPAVTEAFKNKVIAIASDLNTDPSYLMTAISIETSRLENGHAEPTFNPTVQRPGSSAVGLIQFTAQTAAALGTSMAALKAMSAVEQLEYVKKYLKRYAGKLSSAQDVYFAIFYPAFIGAADSAVLPGKYYGPYKTLDKDRDGKVSKAEVSAYVSQMLEKGLAWQG